MTLWTRWPVAVLLGATATLGSDPAPPLISRVEIAPRVTQLTWWQPGLERELALLAVLPADYDPIRRWPVLVFLHGNGRHPRSLWDSLETRTVLLDAPFVTVFPEGLRGWYIDSPVDPSACYQQALTTAIAVADANFSLRADPAGRAIGGWSMGGYGAAWYAVCKPGRFGALGTLIGCLDFPNADLPDGQNHSVPGHFGPPDGWPQFNPLARVEALAGTALWHHTATRAFDLTMNENWHRALVAAGLPHTYEVTAGGHSWPVVVEALPRLFDWFARQLID